METMIGTFFTVKSSGRSKFVGKQFIELSAPNECYDSGVLWRFATHLIEESSCKGFLEKLQYDNPIPFTANEAEEAIKAKFRHAIEIKLGAAVDPTTPEFRPFTSCSVCFRIQISPRDDGFPELQCRDDPCSLGRVETGRQRFDKSSNPIIYGLLTAKEIVPLATCANILGEMYSPKNINWLTYCVNPDTFKRIGME